MNHKGADQLTDAYVMEFDVLRKKAEARMAMGRGFPDDFVSILRMLNASLSESGKSRALASRVRRRCERWRNKRADSSDHVERQHVKTYCWQRMWIRPPRRQVTTQHGWRTVKPKKERKKEEAVWNPERRAEIKNTEDGRTAHGFSRRAGERNRRCTCNCE